jgi:hypothetical protein
MKIIGTTLEWKVFILNDLSCTGHNSQLCMFYIFISFCLLFAVVKRILSLKKLFQEAMPVKGKDPGSLFLVQEAVRKKVSQLLPVLQVCNMSHACHHYVGSLVYSFNHLKIIRSTTRT